MSIYIFYQEYARLERWQVSEHQLRLDDWNGILAFGTQTGLPLYLIAKLYQIFIITAHILILTFAHGSYSPKAF